MSQRSPLDPTPASRRKYELARRQLAITHPELVAETEAAKRKRELEEAQRVIDAAREQETPND